MGCGFGASSRRHRSWKSTQRAVRLPVVGISLRRPWRVGLYTLGLRWPIGTRCSCARHGCRVHRLEHLRQARTRSRNLSGTIGRHRTPLNSKANGTRRIDHSETHAWQPDPLDVRLGRKRPRGRLFSPHLSRALVRAQTEKRGMPQPTLGRPLDEPYLRHQLRLHPLHLPHLVSRHAAAPAG